MRSWPSRDRARAASWTRAVERGIVRGAFSFSARSVAWRECNVVLSVQQSFVGIARRREAGDTSGVVKLEHDDPSPPTTAATLVLAVQLLASASTAPRTGQRPSAPASSLPPLPHLVGRDDADLERARAPAAEPDQPDLALRPSHAPRLALARRGGRRARGAPSQVREEEARRCARMVCEPRVDGSAAVRAGCARTRRLHHLCGHPRPYL